jgi:glutathione S-transferase
MYNCHQRTHQQPLETYASFVALSLVSGLRYPLLTTIFGVMWCVARVFYSRGYVSGIPTDRYRNKLFAMWVWYSLLGLMISTSGAAVAVADLF